ncbi:hypothetical protein [uncultured Massilia sp.]|uniref:hypothetical protein n=1 Tax=uncultured Massilia sp. TaxID=169973 RepID=UPI0025E711CE|nr:hypothetical protein [uncultured Massilia sp.]
MNRPMRYLAAFVLSGAAHAAPATPPLHATAQQMADLEGSYVLDNGQRADIVVLDGRLYIALPRQRKELVLVAPGQFASRDGRVTVRPHSDGGEDRILLGYQPARQAGTPVQLASGTRRGRGGVD